MATDMTGSAQTETPRRLVLEGIGVRHRSTFRALENCLAVSDRREQEVAAPRRQANLWGGEKTRQNRWEAVT